MKRQKNEAIRKVIGLFLMLSLCFILPVISATAGVPNFNSTMLLGLVSYYDLNETGVTGALDRMGTHTGTGGDSANLNGVISNARLYTVAGADLGSDSQIQNYNLTYSAWINRTVNTTGYIISSFSSGSQGIDFGVGSDGKLGFGGLYSPYQFNTSGNVLPLNKWVNVVVTVQQTATYPNATLYVNGSYIGSWIGNYNNWGIKEVFLGHGGTAHPTSLNGGLDEVAIWNRSLSAAEISTLYNIYTNSTPIVALNSPSNNSNYLSSDTIIINATELDNFNLNSAKLYIDNVLNETKNISGLTNETIFNKIITVAGDHTYFITVCNILNNCVNSPVNTLNIKNYKINNASYNNLVYETSLQNFSLNVSYNNLFYNSITANIYYNNTIYAATTTNINPTEIKLNTLNIPIPSITTTGTNLTFFWELTFYNSTGTYIINTTVYNQTINKANGINVIAGTSCTAGTSSAYNFNFASEQNLTQLNNISVSYNFQYGYGASVFTATYGNITVANNFTVCINNSQPNLLLNYGEVQYSLSGYNTRKYYLFSGTILNNQTVNNTLYLLDTVSAQVFAFSATTNSLIPNRNTYMALLRWYPNLNSYNIVEMAKTDQYGNTGMSVKLTDTDYRVALYNLNGSLLKLDDPSRFVCLIAPCTYQLISNVNNQDYLSILKIQSSLTFDYTTNIWSYVYNDPSGKTNSMNLTIYKDTGTNSYPICSSFTYGAVGAITCNTTGYTGNLRGEVYRSASPQIVFTSKTVQLVTTFFTSGFGLFIAVILALPIIFVLALVSPVAAVIGGVIALIPALYFNSINLGIIGGLAVLGGIVLHFLKRIG